MNAVRGRETVCDVINDSFFKVPFSFVKTGSYKVQYYSLRAGTVICLYSIIIVFHHGETLETTFCYRIC
jgi:hypothetical protein